MSQGIEFSDMSDDVVDKFAADLRQNQLREDIPGYIRRRGEPLGTRR